MPARDEARRLLPPPADLPSLPLVYTSLRAALEDPRASATRIADIIAQDAALTARLLRLVNSAFFALQIPVETVDRAVLLVGTEQIHDLALATLVMRVFDGIPADLVNMPAFWRHAVATGVTARVLAAYRQEPNIERFFVAGLLHDVGGLVLCRRRPDACREALLRCRRPDGPTLAVAEREIVGVDHAEVGGALLRSWHLPDALTDAVAFHHDPGASVEHPVEAAVAHVADVIAHAMGQAGSGEPRVPPLQAAAWARLGLSPGVLSSVVTEVDRQVEAAASVLAEPVPA